ncbi:MAG TPA: histidinol-phosphatase [Alphaproteobacteria bacterium]|nr:histidinol-phosphatase [Alphaproteobacteria bacterium]
MSSAMNYETQFAAFFDQAADVARDVTLKYFRQNIPVDDKADKSPVTQADREIEQRLRELIKKTFPTHGIIGEEFGKENESAEFVWVIDPIDGTKSFITGRPLFGTIIGLMHNGKPAVGLIDQGYTKERWFGITGQFAKHNGKPIKIAPPRKLDQARLYTGSISMFDDENFENYLALCRAAKLTQYSTDCYAYGLLAMGWADIVVEQKLGLYDVAGVVPIITGAGGVMTDWDGNAIDASFKGKAVAASSKELAGEALALLKR